MKKFHIVCYYETQYSATIEAESYEEAQRVAAGFEFTDDHWNWASRKSVHVEEEDSEQ